MPQSWRRCREPWGGALVATVQHWTFPVSESRRALSPTGASVDEVPRWNETLRQRTSGLPRQAVRLPAQAGRCMASAGWRCSAGRRPPCIAARDRWIGWSAPRACSCSPTIQLPRPAARRPGSATRPRRDVCRSAARIELGLTRGFGRVRDAPLLDSAQDRLLAARRARGSAARTPPGNGIGST